MNKEDTLQAIIDHYEIDDPHDLLKVALSDAFDKGVTQSREAITGECNVLVMVIDDMECMGEFESEINKFNIILRNLRYILESKI